MKFKTTELDASTEEVNANRTRSQREAPKSGRTALREEIEERWCWVGWRRTAVTVTREANVTGSFELRHSLQPGQQSQEEQVFEGGGVNNCAKGRVH